MHCAAHSVGRLAVLLLAATLGGCAGEKKVADARPVEPAPPPTAANAYGLMGCWRFSGEAFRPDQIPPSTEYCFGPQGKAYMTTVGGDEGRELPLGYSASRDGELVFSIFGDSSNPANHCGFVISDSVLQILNCDAAGEYKNECYDIIPKDIFFVCRHREGAS